MQKDTLSRLQTTYRADQTGSDIFDIQILQIDVRGGLDDRPNRASLK